MPSRRSLKRSVANATTAVTQLGVSSGVDIGDIFSQFAGGSDGYAQPSGRNAAATVAVVYCGPDPSIGLLFRKFGKKDSLTRMKAYEELRGRVEDSDDANSSALVSILEPFAAHYMRSALLDPDWRCRAALHSIVGLLVSKLKRHAVRYLPDILPSLYLAGLYDTHIEVCRSASAALAVIFPHQNKREMAIYDKFRDSVREEICWLLSSECTMQELDERFGCSGGGSKVDASDESEERYDRAVCAALAAVPKFAKVWNSDGSSVDPAIATMDFMKFALPPYRSSVRTAALSRCLLPLFSEDILRSKIEQEVDVEKILLLLSATQGDLTVGAATAQFVQVLAEESDLCGKLESSRKLRQRICTTVASGSKIIKSIPAIMRGIASSDDKVALKWSIEELTPSILRALGAPQPAPPPRIVYQVFSECLGIVAANSKFLEYKDEITDLLIELARHFINSGIDDSVPPPSATAKIPEGFGLAISTATEEIADGTLLVADEEFHNSPKFASLLAYWPRSDVVVDTLYRENLKIRNWEQLKALAQMIDSRRLVEDLVAIAELPDSVWEIVYEKLSEIAVEDRAAIYECISDKLLGRNEIDRLIDVREKTKWPEIQSACIRDAPIDVLVDAVEVEAPCRTANSNGLVSFDLWCEKIAPAGYAEDLFTTEEFCSNWGGGDVAVARSVRVQVVHRAVSICLSHKDDEHSFWLDVIDRIATCDAEACRLARPDCVKILVERLFTREKVSDCWPPLAVLFALGWQDLAESAELPKLHTISDARASMVLEQLGSLDGVARPEITRVALELSQARGGKLSGEVEKFISSAVSYEDQDMIFCVLVDLVREDASADYSTLVSLLLTRLKNISVDRLAEDLLSEASLLRLVLRMRKGEVTSETQELIRKYWQPKLSSDSRQEVTNAAKVIEALGGGKIDPSVVERFSSIREGDDEAGVACLWKIEANGEAIGREKVAQITVVNDDTADLFVSYEDLLEKATLRLSAVSRVPERVLSQLATTATPEWILTILDSPIDHPRPLVDCGCTRLCALKSGEIDVNRQTRKLLQRGSLELWLWALHVDPAVLEEVDTRSVYDEVISMIREHPIDDSTTVGRALLQLDLINSELLGWRVLTMLCMRGFEPLDEAAGRWLLPQVGRVISPVLIEVETEESRNVDGVMAQYTASTRELLARKEAADGLKTEVRITLPSDWPMAKAKVQVSPIPGVPSSRNQKLALAVLREMTRAGMAPALRIWSANVERIFDGVEPCVICYSIVSIDSNSLPNKQCRTCKNKFHSDCIYRWFRTSQKTTCPLCQSLF